MPVSFFSENVSFILKNKKAHKDWVKAVVSNYGFKLAELNYIFCSDEHLLSVNKQFLNHDYFTDIITFDQSERENEIAGDIYISIDRIKDNASTHHTEFYDELRRVIIHGVLHLMGYGDKTKSQIVEMRKNEDACLSLYQIT